MIEITPIKKEGFKEPTKQNLGDACYDVVATSINWTKNYIEYGLGFTSRIPPSAKGIIVPRSSISDKDLIMCNSPGQIDSKYRNEWKVRFKYIGKSVNPTRKTYDKLGKLIGDLAEPIILNDMNIYKVGDKIAQIYFEKIYDTEVSGAVELDQVRSGGFGSTGK